MFRQPVQLGASCDRTALFRFPCERRIVQKLFELAPWFAPGPRIGTFFFFVALPLFAWFYRSWLSGGISTFIPFGQDRHVVTFPRVKMRPDPLFLQQRVFGMGFEKTGDLLLIFFRCERTGGCGELPPGFQHQCRPNARCASVCGRRRQLDPATILGWRWHLCETCLRPSRERQPGCGRTLHENIPPDVPGLSPSPQCLSLPSARDFRQDFGACRMDFIGDKKTLVSHTGDNLRRFSAGGSGQVKHKFPGLRRKHHDGEHR